MSRKARLFIPGCFYHIMSRGIDGHDLFCDDDDRRFFCELTGSCFGFSGFQCLAWVLMSNHYHFVIRASDYHLGKLMKSLNSRYARYYNKKYLRRGYLFQDRFKSIATQEQRYLEELIRYVHLNPLRAGVCKNIEQLDNYPWCGHSAIMGNTVCSFQDTRQVLGRFGANSNQAKRKYREFIAGGIDKNADDLVKTVRRSNNETQRRLDGSSWVIGDSEFVRKSMELDKNRRLLSARFIRSGWDLEKLCGLIAGMMKVSPDEIKRRSRGSYASDARKALAWAAYRKLEIPLAEIARYFNVTGPAVTQMVKKGEPVAIETGVAKVIK